MEKLDLLLLDYDKTLATIDKLDGNLFQIRAWALTTCSAVIAFALNENTSIVLAGSVFLCICFLILETIYKSFHDDCLGKTYSIENILQDSISGQLNLPENYIFGVGHAIKLPSLSGLWKLASSGKRTHILTIYFGIIVFTAAAAIYLEVFK